MRAFRGTGGTCSALHGPPCSRRQHTANETRAPSRIVNFQTEMLNRKRKLSACAPNEPFGGHLLRAR